MNTSPQDFCCPICGQMDRVEKVSAILSVGTISGNYTGYAHGGQVQVSGGAQSVLAQRLLPPESPQTPEWGTFSAFSVVLLPIASILLLLLGISDMLQSGDRMREGVTSLLLAAAGVALTVWISIATTKSVRRQKAIWQTAHPRWQQAMVNWDHLYYCARNDAVFVPGTSVSAPSHQMSTII